jgi:hydrogenase nickel incorporation protein HypA/HybF
MHETALAKRILQVVLDRAGGARVVAVHGQVSEDEALSPAALELHFRAHARGTTAEAAELRLELRHVSARCNACGEVHLPEHHLRLCPRCGSHDVVLLGETGVRIDRIEVEEVP